MDCSELQDNSYRPIALSRRNRGNPQAPRALAVTSLAVGWSSHTFCQKRERLCTSPFGVALPNAMPGYELPARLPALVWHWSFHSWASGDLTCGVATQHWRPQRTANASVERMGILGCLGAEASQASPCDGIELEPPTPQPLRSRAPPGPKPGGSWSACGRH